MAMAQPAGPERSFKHYIACVSVPWGMPPPAASPEVRGAVSTEAWGPGPLGMRVWGVAPGNIRPGALEVVT